MEQDAGDEAGRTVSRLIMDLARSALRTGYALLARRVLEPAVGALGKAAVAGARGAVRSVRRFVDPSDPTNTVDAVEAVPRDDPTKTVLVQHFSRRDVRDQFVELMRAEGLDVEAPEETVEGRWVATMVYETRDERCAQAIEGIDSFILQSLQMVEADSMVDYVDEGPLAPVEWDEPAWDWPETAPVTAEAGEFDLATEMGEIRATLAAALDSEMLPEPEEVR
ncbi:MAG: hypothetical protein IJH42_09185 [Atopobiaceae bacterium]|nr:hypothetical protein [Atopobiaceae bacterium]